MKKKVSVIGLIGITLLLVFAGFGGLALVSAEEAPATVPFKATYQTFPVFLGIVDGHMVLEIPAFGNGTHLGNSEWYADSLVDITKPFPPFPQTGEMYFTAANGAKLIGTFAGDSAPNDRGGFDYWGEYWITEGTGRFTGATGNGIYYGGAGEDSGVLTFEGTLMNP